MCVCEGGVAARRVQRMRDTTNDDIVVRLDLPAETHKTVYLRTKWIRDVSTIVTGRRVGATARPCVHAAGGCSAKALAPGSSVAKKAGVRALPREGDAFVSVERCGRWCDLLDALIDLLGLPVPDHELARRVTTHDEVHVVRERDLARIPRGHVACESRFGRISGLLPSCHGSQPAL